MRRVVVPAVCGALLASGLVGATVATAPPAAAATVTASGDPQGLCTQTVDSATNVTVTKSGATCTLTFTNVGGRTIWTVPTGGLTNVAFVMRGGAGGGGTGFTQGYGAVISGTITTLTGADSVHVWVGKQGTNSGSTTPGGSIGGLNGNSGWAGGSSSDIRVGGSTPDFRKLVAGGGGGLTGTSGSNGFNANGATGGASRYPGYSPGFSACPPASADAFCGGGASTNQMYGSGGGGGYAGGGSSDGNFSYGGAGSSYIAPGFATSTAGDRSEWSDSVNGTGTNVRYGDPSLYDNASNGSVVLTFAAANSSSVIQQPVGGAVGAALATQPQVTLQQAGSVPSSPVTVSASIASSPTPSANQIAAVLDGTTTATTDGSGVATFTGLSIRGPTGSYTLSFTATGYPTATSSSFTLTIGTASAALTQITASPTSIQVANPGNTSIVSVQALDAGGNTITSGGATVTLAASTGSTGSVTDVGNGTYTATFTGTSLIGTATITGTLNAAAITDTATVTQTVGAASSLSVTTQPAAGSAYTGQVLGTQPVVRILDAFGNPRSGDTVSVAKTSGTGSLAGTTSVTTDVGGYATFTNLQIDSGAASSSYVLSFTSGSLSQTSSSFTLAKIPTTVTWSPTNLTTNMGVSPKRITPNATASVSAGGGAISYVVTSAGTTGCAVDASTGLLTFATSGTCQVTASAAATPDYASSSSSAVSFVISKVSQTITFGSLTNQAFGTGPYVISGSTDATGLLLTFSSSTPSVCSVTSGTSLVAGATTAAVSLLGTGTCNIEAAQPGDATYAAATSVPRSFTISQGTQAALTFANPSTATFGAPFTLQTTGGTGPGSVSYAVTTAGSAGCAVSASTGALTFTAAGTCDVQATKAGGGAYANVSTSVATITVAPAPQTTSITSAVPTNPLPGETYAVTSTASSGLVTTLSVLAGLGTVCSISGPGATATLTFLATGTCIVMARQPGNGNYLPAAIEDTQVIEVGALNQAITFAALVNRNFGVAPFAVTPTASSSLPVTLATSTPSVCSVSSGGVVTVLSIGECQLSAAQPGDAQYAAATTVTRSFEVLAVAPFAPTLTSSSAGDGSITIAYAAPSFVGGASISGFLAVATPTSGPSVTVPCADLTAPLTCMVTGLTNGTAYTVTVAAINAAGVGAASAASGLLTPAAAAMAVAGAYAVPGDESVTLYFEAISNGGLGGGAFTRYEIYRRVVGGSWSVTPTTTVVSQGSGELSQAYSGLSNGTSYEFKIVVITTANTEEIAGNTTFVTEYPSTVPSAPVGLGAFAVSGTSATVSWSIPLSDGGATISSYRVTVSGGRTCGAVTIDSTTQVGTCTITGLSYSTSYTVTVAAVNRMGAGTTASVTYAAGADPNPGSGGGGGGGGTTDTDGPGTTGTTGDGDAGDGTGTGGGGNGGGGRGGDGAPLPPRFPTPDGPTDDEEERLNKLPTSTDVRGLPPSSPVTGSGPVPATGWIPPGGQSTPSGGPGRGSAYANDLSGRGFRVLDPLSPEVNSLIAGGTSLRVIRSPGVQGFASTWRYTVPPNTMLQVLMPIDPATLATPFALWVQGRTGEWTDIGTTTVVNGEIVMPVLLFDKPGVYQVVATSIDAPAQSRVGESKPTWGRTTVRTIVTVSAADELGTLLCPNMVGFSAESAVLHRGDKSSLKKLSTCLGATPRIVITGYVHGVTNPPAAQALALERAVSVKKYLRGLGFTGRVIVDESIRDRPAECRAVEGRCAIVEIRIGSVRTGIFDVGAMEVTESVPDVPADGIPAPSEQVSTESSVPDAHVVPVAQEVVAPVSESPTTST